MLTWLDGRNGSSFSSLSWNAAQSTLSFTITPGAGANGLEAMVPVRSAAGVLTNLTRDGTPVAYTIEVIKGVAYAFFPGTAGTYAAQYGQRHHGADADGPDAGAREPRACPRRPPASRRRSASRSSPGTISFVLTDSAGNTWRDPPLTTPPPTPSRSRPPRP